MWVDISIVLNFTKSLCFGFSTEEYWFCFFVVFFVNKEFLINYRVTKVSCAKSVFSRCSHLRQRPKDTDVLELSFRPLRGQSNCQQPQREPWLLILCPAAWNPRLRRCRNQEIDRSAQTQKNCMFMQRYGFSLNRDEKNNKTHLNLVLLDISEYTLFQLLNFMRCKSIGFRYYRHDVYFPMQSPQHFEIELPQSVHKKEEQKQADQWVEVQVRCYVDL